MNNQSTRQSWSKAVLFAALQCLSYVSARELSSDQAQGPYDTPSDKCCLVYRKSDFRGSGQEYCLGDEQMEYSFDLDSDNQGNNQGFGSVKCGPLVEATFCPNGTIEVTSGKDNKFQCVEGADTGVQVGSRVSLNSVPLQWNQSTLILEQHPWFAKGAEYLSYTRDKKARIIQDKVDADPTKGPLNGISFFSIDLEEAFDTWGDELDCRYKATHGQGNVGQIEWVNKGGHEYTGLFQGADTGFVRTSDLTEVNKNPEAGERWMLPSIGIKLLRDGMDSGNTHAQIQGRYGQQSYNWFERPLSSFIRGSPFATNDFAFIAAGFEIQDQVTDFIGSIGFSDFASYDQFGNQVEGNPKFPFELEYRPTGEINFASDTYDRSTFDNLKDIPVGSILYKVYARDQPEQLGGQWAYIADIKLKSQLVTSYWGDRKMYFRHYRHDDDFEQEGSWAQYATPFIPEGSGRDSFVLRPQEEKSYQRCPFDWIFNHGY